ncbi:MAG: hypothetical protein Q9174_002983 [Haloplaca sp. 1 TL-2023]
MAIESVKLPGFGKPLDARNQLKFSIGQTEKFPIALIDEGYEAEMFPIRDFIIMELVNTITDKPEWQRKVFDEAIVAKWRAETLNPIQGNAESGSLLTERAAKTTGRSTDAPKDTWSDSTNNQRPTHGTTEDVSPRMFDWVIDEVKYKFKCFQECDFIEALDGTWQSDTLVGEDLRYALEEAVKPLEDVPEIEKDWHPGSNGQVLDLVHPSIYPLVYGQSRILDGETCKSDDCTSWIGKGTILDFPEAETELRDEWSIEYQWLPAEFDAPPNADVTAVSYINNLHPRHHSNLYSIISQVVAKSIPLWDRVLSRIIAPPMQARAADWSNSFRGFSAPEPVRDCPEQGEDEECSDFEERFGDAEDWEDLREVIEPEPGNFKTPAERIRDYGERYDTATPQLRQEPHVDLRNDHDRLQIIVKLANIHLTPENPQYPGGSWHVEGQANESICASALYYYSSSNITDSYLSFRQQTYEGYSHLDYPQYEWKAAEQIYGFKNRESPAVQELGKVLTRESRLLCFPNVMQHKVSPFQLADPSKPGHRKLLALFLVDPHLKIISTENVPPQQHAWWKENVEMAGVFKKLPPELAEMVLDGAGFPVSLETAREQRLELMNERKNFASYSEDVLQEKTYDVSLLFPILWKRQNADFAKAV